MSDLTVRLAVQQARVAELERELAALHAASADTNADDEHDPEGATIAFERQQLVAVLDGARHKADALASAVERERTGMTLACRVCGRPIPAARLEARPEADTCVDCAP